MTPARSMSSVRWALWLVPLALACSRGGPAAQPDALPVACVPHSLSRDERDRSRDLRRELAAATVETRSLDGGYSYRYRADPEVFRKVAEWITLERRCCPFLTFVFRWPPGASPPWFDITGPAGTREFLRAEMPELPRE